MNTTDRNKIVESCRPFSQKNSFCRYVSIVYIAIVVLFNIIRKYLGKYIFRYTGIAALIAAFVFIGSFMPVTVLDDNDVENEVYVKAKNDNAENDKSENVLTIYSDESINEVEQATEVKQSWSTVLVNKQHKIPEDYEFELGTIDGSMKCDSRILGPLKQMFEDAASEDIILEVCSPYRNENRQKYLFSRKVKGYVAAGSSYLDAFKIASTEVTIPGTSEHEIGLALDIVGKTYSSLDAGFAKTPEGMWLSENSYKYGFILRYPKNKENITGISFEPWHYRYVGVEAAKEITEKNITLEEYVEGK